MDAQYHGELDTHAGSTSAALATDGVFVAYALPDAPGVEVAYVCNLDAAPVRLESNLQTRQVTALCLGVGLLGKRLAAGRREISAAISAAEAAGCGPLKGNNGSTPEGTKQRRHHMSTDANGIYHCM